jgi:cell division protein FtsI (penicillin-binding protein 3)
LAGEPASGRSKTPETDSANVSKTIRSLDLPFANGSADFNTDGGERSVTGKETPGEPTSLRMPVAATRMQVHGHGAVVVDAGRRVAVPAFTGSGLRMAVETASGLGLRVEPVGSGVAREQAPAAGTMVPVGTEVVVHFAR